MAWSYDLLDACERSLFENLSVFVGGFSLEGAQAAAGTGGDALAVLPDLVAKSMVQVEPGLDGETRYRVLEPLRQFAYARLSDSGGLEAAHRAHVEYILRVVEPASHGIAMGRLFDRFQGITTEQDNIRAALEWAFATSDVEVAARIGAAMWMWWSRPDRQALGRAWLEQIQALPGLDQVPLATRGRAKVGVAFLAMFDDAAHAARVSEEVARLAEATGDAALYAVALSVQSTSMMILSQVDAAEPLVYASIQAAREANLRWIEVADRRHARAARAHARRPRASGRADRLTRTRARRRHSTPGLARMPAATLAPAEFDPRIGQHSLQLPAPRPGLAQIGQQVIRARRAVRLIVAGVRRAHEAYVSTFMPRETCATQESEPQRAPAFLSVLGGNPDQRRSATGWSADQRRPRPAPPACRSTGQRWHWHPGERARARN
jgi:hypothetical protein